VLEFVVERAAFDESLAVFPTNFLQPAYLRSSNAAMRFSKHFFVVVFAFFSTCLRDLSAWYSSRAPFSFAACKSYDEWAWNLFTQIRSLCEHF